MSNVPIRRSQLIAPFGVGAMMISADGIGLVVGALDSWYENQFDKDVDCEEFKIHEWRLERILGVDHFRLPPDYRRGRIGQSKPNQRLTVPMVRFPQWHYCPRCHHLQEVTLFNRDRVYCSACQGRGYKKNLLVQVPFVAICKHGHLQDFPWREWVHRNSIPQCTGRMTFSSSGDATLAGLWVNCECGSRRNLANITGINGDGTYLSSELEPGGYFSCRGLRPWTGTLEPLPCAAPLKGSLRSASNNYYSRVLSALFLPTESIPPELDQVFSSPHGASILKILWGSDNTAMVTAALRKKFPVELERYDDDTVGRAIETKMTSQDVGSEEDSDEEGAMRQREFEVLSKNVDTDALQTRLQDTGAYSDIGRWFEKITLIPKLRETRVLTGFTRIYPEGDSGQSIKDLMGLMWKSMPNPLERWLPAYIVHGEGIFLSLNEIRLNEWENQPSVRSRTEKLARVAQSLVHSGRASEKLNITPRLILVHTMAHILMNELIFESGYSSASLRERLYVSEEDSMAGFLIYTAAGDSEGTLGGLVRMGRPENLSRVIRRAIEKSRWCSADPVCMEIGGADGQGPDGANLAACHNCALVPETACEQFNRFLDRGMVIGDEFSESYVSGFFSD